MHVNIWFVCDVFDLFTTTLVGHYSGVSDQGTLQLLEGFIHLLSISLEDSLVSSLEEGDPSLNCSSQGFSHFFSSDEFFWVLFLEI